MSVTRNRAARRRIVSARAVLRRTGRFARGRRPAIARWGAVSISRAAPGRHLALEAAPRIAHALIEMRLSHQVQYAICGAFDLAYNGQGSPVQIRVISERQGIPGRYLEQIFQRLRRAGLVTSKRGPGGGYSLSRSPERISLLEIVEAMEGPLDEAMRMQAPEAGGSVRFRPEFVWPTLARRIGRSLDEISLEALCGSAAKAAVERAEGDPPMYFI